MIQTVYGVCQWPSGVLSWFQAPALPPTMPWSFDDRLGAAEAARWEQKDAASTDHAGAPFTVSPALGAPGRASHPGHGGCGRGSEPLLSSRATQATKSCDSEPATDAEAAQRKDENNLTEQFIKRARLEEQERQWEERRSIKRARLEEQERQWEERRRKHEKRLEVLRQERTARERKARERKASCPQRPMSIIEQEMQRIQLLMLAGLPITKAPPAPAMPPRATLWCKVCRKAFHSPEALRDHTKAKHEQPFPVVQARASAIHVRGESWQSAVQRATGQLCHEPQRKTKKSKKARKAK